MRGEWAEAVHSDNILEKSFYFIKRYRYRNRQKEWWTSADIVSKWERPDSVQKPKEGIQLRKKKKKEEAV